MRKLTPDSLLSEKYLNIQVECFGAPEDLPDIVAVAVSGGSDSTALLRLAERYWKANGKRVVALTVDHGLRPESAEEAQQMAAWCDELGVEHHILRWSFDGKGNLSAAAREGRYRAMAEYCSGRGIECLYTGHTMDDQAETVLMRFARGSGVDGLAGMAERTALWGVTIVRPFIASQTRENLRQILRELGQDWIDDPSNEDANYDRVKARTLFRSLEPLGVTVQTLSGLARRMSLAKEVLQQDADRFLAAGCDHSPLGIAEIRVDAVAAVPLETACRVIGQIAKRIGGSSFRASLDVEEELVKLALGRQNSGGRTSGGCIFRPAGDVFQILREPARCAPRISVQHTECVWDHRFNVRLDTETTDTHLRVGALGEKGLAQIPKDHVALSKGWCDAPREARLTTPGLWQGDVLLSAPLMPWVSSPSGPKLLVSTVWSKMC